MWQWICYPSTMQKNHQSKRPAIHVYPVEVADIPIAVLPNHNHAVPYPIPIQVAHPVPFQSKPKPYVISKNKQHQNFFHTLA